MDNRFQETITDDQLKEMESAGFDGEIIVVDNSELLSDACRYLSSQHVIGFDTETRPAFTKGKSNSVALLQLSSKEKAFLFRLNHIALEKPLLKLLSSKEIIKSGAAIRDDIKALQKLRQFTPGGFIDLQSIVADYGIADKSLRKMAAITLGIKISKAQRLSNWEAAALTPAQQHYAATDAWVSRQIYIELTRK